MKNKDELKVFTDGFNSLMDELVARLDAEEIDRTFELVDELGAVLDGVILAIALPTLAKILESVFDSIYKKAMDEEVE